MLLIQSRRLDFVIIDGLREKTGVMLKPASDVCLL